MPMGVMGDASHLGEHVTGLAWVSRFLPTHFCMLSTSLHILLRVRCRL